MAKTAKVPQIKEPDDGKTAYIVNRAHRVGEPQRWYKPGDTVRLLPCEAQFSLSRGWLIAEGITPTASASDSDKPSTPDTKAKE